MRRSVLALLTLLILSACGGSAADEALQGMHDAYGKRVKDLHVASRPAIAATDFALDLTNYSLSGILETEFHAVIRARGRYDVTDPQDPVIEQNLSLDASTLNAKTKKPTADMLAASIAVNVVKKTLSVNISDILLSAPDYLPQPLALPGELRSRWYGESFADLNKRFDKQAATTGGSPRTLENILESIFGSPEIRADETMRLWKSLHIWKGTNVRTDGTGTYVDVVTDRRKLAASLRAIADYVRRAGGSSWENAERNPDFSAQMRELTNPRSETMKRMPILRGTLSMDSATFALRGFSGSMVSSTGAMLATIDLTVSSGGDMSFTLRNTDHPDVPLVVKKKGEAVSISVGADAVLTGTVSKTAIVLVLTDPRTKKPTLKADVAIRRLTKEVVELGAATLAFPEKGTLALSSLFMGKEEDVLNLSLNGSWKVNGKDGLAFSLSYTRRPTETFSLERRSLLPFDQIESDLSSIVTGMASAAP